MRGGRGLTATAAATRSAPPGEGPDPRAGWIETWPGLVLVALALLGLAVGLVAGVRGGPLWLDEALSVEIARLPLSDLPGALRQDGAPPLYYVLLHGWMILFGTGTTAVRLLSVVLVPVALLLAYRLGGRLGGVAGGRAAVVVLASLPWTMRFGSETRMYALVVVLVLAGALALLAVRAAPSRTAVGLGAVAVTGLLLTHYWALFLLAAVGIWHLPGLARRSAAAVRVVTALVLGGVLFLPWLPVLVFQSLHTGAPWAAPPELLDLLRTPTFWGGGGVPWRWALVAVLLPLLAVAVGRRRPARALVAVASLTLLLAWTQTTVAGGAYTGRYTAVVVPLVAVAAGLGAIALPGRAGPLLALALLTLVGTWSGVPAAAVPRTSAAEIADAVRDAALPGALLAFCPDQLGPPVQRLLGADYEQVLYPTLAPPQRIDWVDYAERQAAADPAAVARELDARAGARPLLVLKASRYRTFGGQCEALLAGLTDLRGPATHHFGREGTTGQLLYRFR